MVEVVWGLEDKISKIVVFLAYREMDYMRLSTTESKKCTKKEALKYTNITLYL
jgi:hypothetical protein